jgi:hypothetical protein
MNFVKAIIKYCWYIGLVAITNQLFSILWYRLVLNGIICDDCTISAIAYLVTAIVDVLTMVTMVGMFIMLVIQKDFVKALILFAFYLIVILLNNYLNFFGMINWYD